MNQHNDAIARAKLAASSIKSSSPVAATLRSARAGRRTRAKPDWTLWRALETAKLWEWVALFVGLDPDQVSRDEAFKVYDGADENFTRLLRIAISSVESGGLKCRPDDYEADDLGVSKVRQGEFLRWARSKGVPLPTKLADVAAPRRASDVEWIEGWKAIADRMCCTDREARRRVTDAGVAVQKHGGRVSVAAADVDRLRR